MNILFFLTPKAQVRCVYDTDTLRQALEKMDHYSYASIPIIREADGTYVGTLTEGDLLRHIKERYDLSLKEAEDVPLLSIRRRRDYLPVSISANIEDMLLASASQNFVPVVDDSRAFIGIITRKDVILYLTENLHRNQEKGSEPHGD